MEKNDDLLKSVKEGGRAPGIPSDAATPDDYMQTIKAHVRNGKHREAYLIAQEAALEYPDDAGILSYTGWLQALVERRYRPGVDKCRRALSMMQERSALAADKLYPALYLNLGRAYAVAGKKKDAFEAFHLGLINDKQNREILQELKALGRRKTAPVPFLDRSNPINKFVGKILHPANKSAKRK